MNYFFQFLIAAIATSGFCLYFKVPKKAIPISCFISGWIWVMFDYLQHHVDSYILPGFLAAFCIGCASELCAIFFKKPVTVFSLPCLIPLVPGAGMYYTMYHFIEGSYDLMMDIATKTFFTAASLSLGIISSTTVIHVIKSIRKFKKV
ncbi:MAG: threonine/serine exporter family protein [Tissierellia bacterium]|nr:threonine/serine exporter family protein [Tissierellia bacterium]